MSDVLCSAPRLKNLAFVLRWRYAFVRIRLFFGSGSQTRGTARGNCAGILRHGLAVAKALALLCSLFGHNGVVQLPPDPALAKFARCRSYVHVVLLDVGADARRCALVTTQAAFGSMAPAMLLSSCIAIRASHWADLSRLRRVKRAQAALTRRACALELDVRLVDVDKLSQLVEPVDGTVLRGERTRPSNCVEARRPLDILP